MRDRTLPMRRGAIPTHPPPNREAPLIPCRCRWLNTLTGRAATDYVRQHLDTVGEIREGRTRLTCVESGATFVLEPDHGVYGGDDQVRLRRSDR